MPTPKQPPAGRRRVSIPTPQEVTQERARLAEKKQFYHTLFTTVGVLLVVAAAAILAATTLLPVVQVGGASMQPTLQSGDALLLLNTSDLSAGDVCAFYWQNELLVKRVIATPGDVVDISADGTVWVNGTALDEPYLTEKSQGTTDLTYPYQVPGDRYFVMGDARSTSVDSRSSTIGCITRQQIVGRALCRVWPLNRITFRFK